eukprot:m.30336 g.30336  ORF g.30336 m.30336 type:complete len:159 (+) comp6780_c0_seq1:87-563(+)
MATAAIIDRDAQCYCGEVTLRITGSIIFSGYCHCKPCTRFRGVSPVHLVGVKPAIGVTVTKGKEHVKVVHDPAGGKMEHGFCTNCGCGLFQSPTGAPFRAVFPTNFRFEDGPYLCTLPPELMPTSHGNYDNRTRDFKDGLPKRMNGHVVDDEGNPIIE